MDCKLIYGHVESFYLQWFVDTYLFKIAIHHNYIRKFYQDNMYFQILFQKILKIYYKKYFMLIQAKDIEFNKYMLISGVNYLKMYH